MVGHVSAGKRVLITITCKNKNFYSSKQSFDKSFEWFKMCDLNSNEPAYPLLKFEWFQYADFASKGTNPGNCQMCSLSLKTVDNLAICNFASRTDQSELMSIPAIWIHRKRAGLLRTYMDSKQDCGQFRLVRSKTATP